MARLLEGWLTAYCHQCKQLYGFDPDKPQPAKPTCAACDGRIELHDYFQAEIDSKIYKWTPRFTRIENELNRILREAAGEGIKPLIKVHEDEKMLGKDVQAVEVSVALGILRKDQDGCANEKENL